MGCDIHIVLERKYNDKWIGVTDYSSNPDHLIRESDKFKFKYCYTWVRGRNYDRFAALAGVRGDGPAPKGLPENISDLIQMKVNDWEEWDEYSFLSLNKACKIFVDSLKIQENEWDEYSLKTTIKNYPEMPIFEIDDENLDNYRIVFWFDN